MYKMIQLHEFVFYFSMSTHTHKVRYQPPALGRIKSDKIDSQFVVMIVRGHGVTQLQSAAFKTLWDHTIEMDWH